MKTVSLEVIQHGMCFHEIVLRDFRRETLLAMKAEVLKTYHRIGGPDQPYSRNLFDLRLIAAPTPYSIQVFQTMNAELVLKTTNIRAAMLVNMNMFYALLIKLVRETKFQNGAVFRIMTERDEALRWLREEIPAEAEGDTKRLPPLSPDPL